MSMCFNEMYGFCFGLTEVDSRTLFSRAEDFLTSLSAIVVDLSVASFLLLLLVCRSGEEDLRRDELPDMSEVLSLRRPFSRFACTLNFFLFFLKLLRLSLNQRLISSWSSFSCFDNSSSFLTKLDK